MLRGQAFVFADTKPGKSGLALAPVVARSTGEKHILEDVGAANRKREHMFYGAGRMADGEYAPAPDAEAAVATDKRRELGEAARG